MEPLLTPEGWRHAVRIALIALAVWFGLVYGVCFLATLVS